MPVTIPLIGYGLFGLFLLSLVGLVIGWNHPEKVLPQKLRPTIDVARIIYVVLAAWLLGGSIVFLFVAKVNN